MKTKLTLKILLLVMVLGMGGKSWGQVYLNTFTGASACPTNGNTPVIASNATGTALTRSTIICNATANVFNSTTLNNTASISNTSYIEFTATANAGYQLNLTSVSFLRQGSNTAPNQVEVRYSTDGFLTSTTWGAAPVTPTSGTVATWDFADFSTAAGGTVAFRVYPYGTTRCDLTAPAAATTGTFRLDDVTINGTVTSTATAAFNISSSLTTFSTSVGVPSTQQSYTISGLNLTPNQVNGISVTAPADFEVSLTSNTFTGTNGNTVLLSSNGTGNIVGEPVTVYVRYLPAVSGTTTVNITHSGAGVSPAQNLSVSGVSTAYFYSKATGNLTDPATFNTAADGSGTDAVNFTANNQTFEIRNRTTATITADWTVSGTLSRIVVGSGVDFTIPSTNSVTGTINVIGTGKLTLQNSILPIIGTLATGSTVEYAQSTAISILNTTTDAVTYANLRLSGTGIKSFKNSSTTITGNLIYDGSTNGALTIDAASAATFTTINLGGDLTYLGSVTSPSDANSYTLVTTSAGTQTITGNNNIARFFRITENSAGNNVVLSTIGGSTNTLVGNLTGGGITLTNATSTLSLNGNTLTYFAGNNTTSGAGTITGSATSSIVINKTGATAFGILNFTSGFRSLNSLTINHTGTAPGTVTLGTALDIYGTLTVTAGQLALGANNLTLKSTSTGTAMVANSAGTISGDVTVERYINSDVVGRKWHLISGKSTVTTKNIFESWQENGATGIALPGYGTWITSGTSTLPGYDATSAGSASILTHNPAAPAWVTPAATNTGAVSDSAGYMIFVRGDRNATAANALTAPTVLRTTGSLRQGPQTGVAILNTNPAYTLIGNPYASPVDFEAISGTSNLSSFFYIWDASYAGTYGVGGFRLVQRTGLNTYTATPTTGSDNTLRYIHSGQAFFVKTDGVGDASVVFTEGSKSTQTSVVNPIVAVTGDQQIYTSLLVVNGGKENLADAVRVRFNDAYKAATTDDAPKMVNFAENISSFRNDKKWIVEQRPMIQQRDTIFLRMSNTGIKDYRLQVNTIDFVQTAVSAYLEDTYKGSKTALELNGAVNNIDFSVSADAASANPDRFRIVFENKAVQPKTAITIKAAQSVTTVAVEWKAFNQYNMKQYELERSTDAVHYTKVNTQSAIGINGTDVNYNWTDANPAIGDNYYRVSSITVRGDITISQPAIVTISKIGQAITVYPNPVINHTVSLQFTGMEKGLYQLRLFSTAGQLIFTKAINHTGGTGMQNLLLDNGIAKGNYRLEIIKPDNTKTNQAILITK